MNLSNYKSHLGDELIITNVEETYIEHLVIDSREIFYANRSLFFAIKGNVVDGHNFIKTAYDKGIRNFVVNDDALVKQLPDVNYIKTNDIVATLQNIATKHRSQFDLLSIGITGSNGKTIVKEWLSIMLSQAFSVVKTPQSFNSQIGVALSIWQINKTHQMGIFEAGISQKDEMSKLETMIQPKLGILTNIGDAHDSGFDSHDDKLHEKLKLFANAEQVIYNGDDTFLHESIKGEGNSKKYFSWGFKSHNHVVIQNLNRIGNSYQLSLLHDGMVSSFDFSFEQEYYFENLMHCITTGLLLKLNIEKIEESIRFFGGLEMRLELNEGINNTLLVNDSYTNDIEALDVALSFVSKHSGDRKKIIILSDLESNHHQNANDVLNKLKNQNFTSIFLVGEAWTKYIDLTEGIFIFENTESLMNDLSNLELNDSIVLIKGARRYGFEKIFEVLKKQSHSVFLDIDMKAVAHNLSVFSSYLKNGSSIMPIIKANAYGAGAIAIAKLLQYKGVQTIGVAFADEGAVLRNNGITIPIVVLNGDRSSFNFVNNYNLEIEIYSREYLYSFLNWNNGIMMPHIGIHLKIDTGMSRLGIQVNEIEKLNELLKTHKPKVVSIFSHLSSSEDEADDDFSHLQASKFLAAYHSITASLGYEPKKHILNSAGIVRFPEYHFDWVRLGLGLYGVDSTAMMGNALQKVHALKAKILQIKKLEAGDYVGYNRKHKVVIQTTIAIVNIGYADGLPRLAGNSKYHILVKGNLCPIIGNVCMDLIIVDVSQVPNIEVADEVTLFDKALPIEKLAKVSQTIPYEILCGISARIKRNYLEG